MAIPPCCAPAEHSGAARANAPSNSNCRRLRARPTRVKASSAVISACAAGELSPHEATAIMGLISTHVRTIEVAELEARLSAVEKRQQP